MDIPLVECFVYKEKYYVYDAGKNQILNVTKDQYMQVSQLKNTGVSAFLAKDDKAKSYEDICFLIKKGFFKPTNITKIQHPDTKYVATLLDQSLTTVIFQVTQDCNFCCRYCTYANSNITERKHTKQQMNWETAKQGVDFIYEHSGNSLEVEMFFYGGEPLLNYPLIAKIVDYSNKEFMTKRINYSMTINGSILTDEMLDFFIKNDFRLVVSFDGKEDIQNAHRKFYNNGGGTFKTVLNNVMKVKHANEEYFKNRVSVMPVIFYDERYSDVFNFFKSIGIDNINPLSANLNGIDYTLRNNLMSGNRNLIDNFIDDFEETLSIYNDKKPLPSIWHHGGPCIAGSKRLFIDVRGRLFPCEKVPESDALSIGTVKEGFDIQRIVDFLNIGTLTESNCKNCWAIRFCNLCIEHCYDIDTKALCTSRKDYYCKYQKKSALKKLKDIIDSPIY